MIRKRVTAGDTYPVVFKYKPEGNPTNLPEGYDLMIGLREEGGNSIKVFSLQYGEIQNPDEGVYVCKISHEVSRYLKGNVIVDMVIYSRDASFVKHCNEPLVLEIIPSFMNEQLDHE